MKDEIRRAFDDMTEAPHPALRASLRARLAGGPIRTEPAVWRFAAAVAVLAIVAIVAYGGLSMLSRGRQEGPAPAGNPSVSPSIAASPSPEASPTAAPSPTADPLGAFICTTYAAGDPASGGDVTGVRVGTATGYDRLVFQFDGPVPQFTITPQDNSSFVIDASGMVVQLQGSRGLRVVIHSAAGGYDRSDGIATYSGPNDFTPGYPALKEARNVGDFERVYSWGLGVSGGGCYRAFTLAGPDRLVIDLQQP
jgi:hypothetical protein